MKRISDFLIYVVVSCYCAYEASGACSPLPRRKGVQFSCRISNTRSILNCNEASTIPVGTIAEYMCAKYYVQVHFIEEIKRSPTLTCTESSSWSDMLDFKKFSCQPDCGQARPKNPLELRPFIIDGRSTNATLWPWHATIYSSNEYSCGGTLVNAFNQGLVILSAAHCFLDSRNNKPISTSVFRIALGAQSSDIGRNVQDPNVQMFNVDRVISNDEYQGEPSYSNDIAIVKLDRAVRLTDTVSPVCLSASGDLAEEQLIPGSIGETVGFGFFGLELQASLVLRHAFLPVVPKRECQESLNTTLTAEEICAGYLKGIAVCKGDSGGGLVFNHESDDDSRYYIQGIVSHGFVRNEVHCENYGIFTRVNSHAKWIDDQVRGLRIGNDEYEAETERPPEPTVRPQNSYFQHNTVVPYVTSTTTRRSFVTYPSTTAKPELEYIYTTTLRPKTTTNSVIDFPPYLRLALQIHNDYRNLHSVPPLQLNEMLNNEARKYAEMLIRTGTFVNRNDPVYTSETLPFMKNIFQIREKGGSLPITQIVSQAITSWYNEIKFYNWDDPTASAFAQIVWKSTTDLGLGYATGFQDSARRTVIVAAYAPPGNIIGKDNHQMNVFSKSKHLRHISWNYTYFLN